MRHDSEPEFGARAFDRPALSQVVLAFARRVASRADEALQEATPGLSSDGPMGFEATRRQKGRPNLRTQKVAESRALAPFPILPDALPDPGQQSCIVRRLSAPEDTIQLRACCR
jgi:hypothetical protein